MLIAMVMVPIVAMMQLNGWDTFNRVAEMKPTNLDLFRGTTTLGIISFCLGIRILWSTTLSYVLCQ